MIALRKDAELSLRIQLYRVVYVYLTSIEKQCDHDIRRKYGNRLKDEHHDRSFRASIFIQSRLFLFVSRSTISFPLYPSFCSFFPGRFSRLCHDPILHRRPFLIAIFPPCIFRSWSGEHECSRHRFTKATIASICSTFVRILPFFPFPDFFFSFCFWDKDHAGLMYSLKYI